MSDKDYSAGYNTDDTDESRQSPYGTDNTDESRQSPYETDNTSVSSVREYRRPARKDSALQIDEDELNLYGKKKYSELDELLPVPSKALVTGPQKAITPRNYDAIEAHGYFGLIYQDSGVYNEHLVIVHTAPRLDRQHMLALKEGDTIDVVYLRQRKKGQIKVRYVTRSKYFAPGSPVTSLLIGVDTWNWDRLQSTPS